MSVYDAIIPKEKPALLAAGDTKVAKIEDQYETGLITREERHRQIVDVWTRVTDEVGDAMGNSFEKFNPIYMMAYSGARGNIKQIRQLAGMRGLVEGPRGDLDERPIKANYREGLSSLDYFRSVAPARLALSHKSLTIAHSGHLTRRLVDVAQDVIVRELDCGTDEAVAFNILKDDDVVDHNVVGRCLLEPAVDSKTGEILIEAGGSIASDEVARKLADAGVEKIVARTVMTCHAKHGICQACYGWDLASSRPVDIGTAVGIIAAQSIGEPAVSVMFNAKHSVGFGGQSPVRMLSRVTELLESRKPEGQAILAEVSGKLTIEDVEKVRLLTVTDAEGHEKTYAVSRRATLLPRTQNGAEIELGQQLTKGSVNPHDLLALKGPNETLRYIVEQVQDVYRSDGVDINDKHIEVISRQMLRKVSVTEPGDTDFLPGQLVDRLDFASENADALSGGGEPANGYPTLLGITKASFATDSYLSAASFQETTRVLTDAAIAGKEDNLLGLKENVIIGKLIPAATGMKRYRNVKLTYKGQRIEAESAVEGPLPEWAPAEHKEIEALLATMPERPELFEADFESAFADLDLEDGEIDVSAFTGVTFDPNAEIAAAGEFLIEEADMASMEDASSLTLSDIGVSARWVNKFEEAGIVSAADLVGKTEDELIDLPGIGQKAVEEVKEGLAANGMSILDCGGPAIRQARSPDPVRNSSEGSSASAKARVRRPVPVTADELNLAPSISRELRAAGIETIAHLQQRSITDLVTHFGLTGSQAQAVSVAMTSAGLHLSAGPTLDELMAQLQSRMSEAEQTVITRRNAIRLEYDAAVHAARTARDADEKATLESIKKDHEGQVARVSGTQKAEYLKRKSRIEAETGSQLWSLQTKMEAWATKWDEYELAQGTYLRKTVQGQPLSDALQELGAKCEQMRAGIRNQHLAEYRAAEARGIERARQVACELDRDGAAQVAGIKERARAEVQAHASKLAQDHEAKLSRAQTRRNRELAKCNARHAAEVEKTDTLIQRLRR